MGFSCFLFLAVFGFCRWLGFCLACRPLQGLFFWLRLLLLLLLGLLYLVPGLWFLVELRGVYLVGFPGYVVLPGCLLEYPL